MSMKERERERGGGGGVVNKHTSAFLHSAFAQRGTDLLRIHTANTILHTHKTCTLSITNPTEKQERKKRNKTKQTNIKNQEGTQNTEVGRVGDRKN